MEQDTEQQNIDQTKFHTHNGINSPQLTGRAFVNAPQSALTTVNNDTINTGDATSDVAITNMRTRINELEARLQALELIR